MSEMGVDKNSSMLEATSPACARPEAVADAAENNVGVTPCTPVASTGGAEALQEEQEGASSATPPPADKKAKKKKSKAGGYKSFLKSALRGSADDGAKKEQYLQKISKTMGGGGFDKLPDKL
jgi:hypothetical protein